MTSQPTQTPSRTDDTGSDTLAGQTPVAQDAREAGRLSAPVVAALEATWDAIRSRHPDLPAVVVVLAAGSIGAPRGALRLGHFAVSRWDHHGDALAEVFVGGEGLIAGPAAVLGTLLHEAAHALAHVRGVKDTSRDGRYHNRRFAALAAEVGLSVRTVGAIGWSDTDLTEATRTAYAAEITALGVALVIHRRAERSLTGTGAGTGSDDEDGADTGAGSGGRGSSNNGTVCRCECGRRIRVAPTVLERGAILCGCCASPFQPTGTPG